MANLGVNTTVLPTSANRTPLIRGAYSFNFEKDGDGDNGTSEKIYRCNNNSCPVRLHTTKSAQNPEIKRQTGTHNHVPDPKVQVELVWRKKIVTPTTNSPSTTLRKILRPCGHCGKKSADLVEKICIRREDEVGSPPTDDDAEGTNISISDALFSLTSFWLGSSSPAEISSPLLEFCPPCALIFKAMYQITMQFQSLGGGNNSSSQVSIRLKTLRDTLNKSHSTNANPTPTNSNSAEIPKTGQRSRKQKLHDRNVKPEGEEEEERQIKKDDKTGVILRDEDEIKQNVDMDAINLDDEGHHNLNDLAPHPVEPDDIDSPPPPEENSPQTNPPQKSKTIFPCSACPKKFAWLASLRCHFRNEHDPAFTPYRCPVSPCGTKFNEFFALKFHMDTKHPGVSVPLPPKRSDIHPDYDEEGRTRIRCPVESCPKSYLQREGVYNHMKTAHPDVPMPKLSPQPRNFKACPICQKNVRDFRRHVIAHTNQRDHLCTKCGKLFKSSNILRMHDRIVHIRERKYICATCGASFFQKGTHDEHVKYRHEIPPGAPFSCDTCGKSYRRATSLKEHEATHTSKRFECLICPKTRTFCRKHQLRDHLRWMHPAEGEKNEDPRFSCETCGKKYRKVKSFKKHVQAHATKEFQCLVCLKLFGRQEHLMVHVRRMHETGKEKSGKAARGEKGGKVAEGEKSGNAAEGENRVKTVGRKKSVKAPGRDKSGKVDKQKSGKVGVKVAERTKKREYKTRKRDVPTNKGKK